MPDINKYLADETDYNEKQAKKSASSVKGAESHITQNEKRTIKRRKRNGPMM